MEDIEKELNEQSINESSKKGSISQRFATFKKQLNIPISKPEVYKPLLLIITIICLQHFSGLAFTRRFLLQILAPAKKFEDDGEVPNAAPEKEEENFTAYYCAILINAIRMAASILMSDFLKRFRLYKISNEYFQLNQESPSQSHKTFKF